MGRLKIFNYHNVSVPPAGARMVKLYVTPAQFDRQCRMLKQLGLRGVSLGEGLRAMERGESNRCVVLTFDDGYTDNLLEAAPIMRRYGFSATCYIVAGCIGTHNVWDAKLLAAEKPLMSLNQIKQWVDAGHEIGSHTFSHPHLHTLDRSTAEREVVASKFELERLTGAKVEHFCYPFGEYNEETLELVRSAGYVSAVTTQRGVASDANDKVRLPRISINGDKGLFKFALKAATSYAGLSWGRAA